MRSYLAGQAHIDHARLALRFGIALDIANPIQNRSCIHICGYQYDIGTRRHPFISSPSPGTSRNPGHMRSVMFACIEVMFLRQNICRG